MFRARCLPGRVLLPRRRGALEKRRRLSFTVRDARVVFTEPIAKLPPFGLQTIPLPLLVPHPLDVIPILSLDPRKK